MSKYILFAFFSVLATHNYIETDKSRSYIENYSDSVLVLKNIDLSKGKWVLIGSSPGIAHHNAINQRLKYLGFDTLPMYFKIDDATILKSIKYNWKGVRLKIHQETTPDIDLMFQKDGKTVIYINVLLGQYVDLQMLNDDYRISYKNFSILSRCKPTSEIEYGKARWGE